MMGKNEKLAVLLCSGALFVLGVAALGWEPGRVRTGTLAAVFAALAAIAVRQTIRVTHGKNGNGTEKERRKR